MEKSVLFKLCLMGIDLKMNHMILDPRMCTVSLALAAHECVQGIARLCISEAALAATATVKGYQSLGMLFGG